MTSFTQSLRMVGSMIHGPRGGRARPFLHVCFGAWLLCSGCIAPIPMTKRTSGPAGTIEKKKIDLKFLQPGKTTRDEVIQELAWVDSGIKEEHLFVARWASSGSGWVWLGPDDCGAPLCRDLGPYRNWTVHNLIVDFDDAAIVKSTRDVPTPELAGSLEAWIALASAQPAEMPTPVELNAYQLRPSSPIATARLVLSSDSFEYRDSRKPKKNFLIRAGAIKSIASGSDDQPRSALSLGQVAVSIVFREGTPAGKHISLKTSPPDLLVLIKYVHAANGAPHVP